MDVLKKLGRFSQYKECLRSVSDGRRISTAIAFLVQKDLQDEIQLGEMLTQAL